MKTIKALLLIIVVLLFAGLIYLYSGAYNIGADVPHTAPVHWALSVLRDRSIATHAKGIRVPPLTNPEMIATGAHHYAEMCSGCHLAPGMPDTEIRQGLYPQPPDLARGTPPPAETVYWVVKHGIKFTAMPAWGATHDETALWAIVAFVEKLPSLSSDQYAAMTSSEDAAEVAHGNGASMPASPASTVTPAASGSSLAPASPSSAAGRPASTGSSPTLHP